MHQNTQHQKWKKFRALWKKWWKENRIPANKARRQNGYPHHPHDQPTGHAKEDLWQTGLLKRETEVTKPNSARTRQQIKEPQLLVHFLPKKQALINPSTVPGWRSLLRHCPGWLVVSAPGWPLPRPQVWFGWSRRRRTRRIQTGHRPRLSGKWVFMGKTKQRWYITNHYNCLFPVKNKLIK